MPTSLLLMSNVHRLATKKQSAIATLLMLYVFGTFLCLLCLLCLQASVRSSV